MSTDERPPTEMLRLSEPFCGDEQTGGLLTPELAQERILANLTPLGEDEIETLELRHALDRVLAHHLIAPIAVPGHANAAMDGYAVHSSDLPEHGSCELLVAGQSFAGHAFYGVAKQGHCIRIMTGAVVPEGCDTVIPQEHVERIDDGRIRIDGRTRPGANVRAAGEDVASGETVLKQGRQLNAADLGLIASLGFERIPVVRPVRVAFVTTGDELRNPGETLGPGEIYDSNRHTLRAMLSRHPCTVSDFGIARDDPQALGALLQRAAEDHDVIITSGGASVGEADHIPAILREMGNLVFWKIAIKPGRPLIFGHIGQAAFFGLPGNPVAVMVSFSLFVSPALHHLAGARPEPALRLRATCTSPLRKRAGRTEYQRGVLSQTPNGELSVRSTGMQGSGVLRSMSLANCFIVLGADQTRIEPGTAVDVEPFPRWL